MMFFQKSLTFILIVFQIYIGSVRTNSSTTFSVESFIPTAAFPEENFQVRADRGGSSSTPSVESSVSTTTFLEQTFPTEPSTENAESIDSYSTVPVDVITSPVPVRESNDLSETSSSAIPTTIKIAATSSGSLSSSTSKPSTSSPEVTASPSSPTSYSLDSKSFSVFSTKSSHSKSSLKLEPTTPKPLLSKSGTPFRPSLIRCPEDYIDEYATNGKYFVGENSKENCRRAGDCLWTGWANKTDMNVSFLCVFSEDFMDSGCCYKDTKKLCTQGYAAFPLEECTSVDDCNLQGDKSMKRWCDPVSKTCCRFDKEHDLFCPDYTIPLMDEPKCENSKPDDVYSGVCPIPNGICKHGHCCPNNKNGTILPGKPYETHMDCTDSTVIPKNLTFGYCDPSSRKVFVMSEENFHGQKNKMLDSFCMSGRDCGRSYTVENVCVRVSEKAPRCFINPNNKYHIPEKRSLFWVSTFAYVSLGTSVLALLFTILYKIFTIDDSLPGERSVSLSEEQSLPLMVSVQ